MGVSSLLFCSWISHSMTVHLADFDEGLWDKLVTETKDLYQSRGLKVPNSVSPRAKELQMEVKQYCDNNVKLMCEVPSITVKHNNLNAESENRDLTSIITRTTSFLQGSYQLCRKKAAEILVWLLSDTDRMWNVEIPHALPVAWAMKGYAMPVGVMRHVWWHIECLCRSQHSCSLHNIWWCFLPPGKPIVGGTAPHSYPALSWCMERCVSFLAGWHCQSVIQCLARCHLYPKTWCACSVQYPNGMVAAVPALH